MKWTVLKRNKHNGIIYDLKIFTMLSHGCVWGGVHYNYLVIQSPLVRMAGSKKRNDYKC